MRGKGLISLAVLLIALPALAADKPAKQGKLTEGQYEAEICPPGDPLCVEKAKPEERRVAPSAPSAPAPSPRPSGAPSATELATRQEMGRVQLRARFGTVRPPAPAVAPRPGAIAPPVQDRRTAEGWEYKFEDDGMSGNAQGCETIRGGRPKFEVPLPCFDAFNTAFRDEKVPTDSVRHAHTKMLRCMDSCVTKRDAEFLTSCLDWKQIKNVRENPPEDYFSLLEGKNMFACPDTFKEQGFREGKYKFSRRDDVTGKCVDGPTKPNLVKITKRLEEEFSETKECPKTFHDVEALKKIAQDILKKKNWKKNGLPMKGKKNIACGYNIIKRKWYKASAYCVDNNVCYDSVREDLPADCDRFIRSTENPDVFVLQASCIGRVSYRNGGRAGDDRYIQLSDHVWLDIAENNRGIFHYGLIFAE